MKGLVTALQFLTILPLPSMVWNEKERKKSLGYFPLVGLILGVISAGVLVLSTKALSPLPSAALSVFTLVWLSGGLHMDGLADLTDGLGARRTRGETLAIMKDPTIGSFGTLALIAILALKVLFLAELETAGWKAMVLAPMFSRWTQLFWMRFYPKARKEGLGAYFASKVKMIHLVPGLVLLLAISYLLLAVEGIMLLVMTFGLLCIIATRISIRLKGLTGDVYGALTEIGETGIFFILCFAPLI